MAQAAAPPSTCCILHNSMHQSQTTPLGRGPWLGPPISHRSITIHEYHVRHRRSVSDATEEAPAHAPAGPNLSCWSELYPSNPPSHVARPQTTGAAPSAAPASTVAGFVDVREAAKGLSLNVFGDPGEAFDKVEKQLQVAPISSYVGSASALCLLHTH